MSDGYCGKCHKRECACPGSDKFCGNCDKWIEGPVTEPLPGARIDLPGDCLSPVLYMIHPPDCKLITKRYRYEGAGCLAWAEKKDWGE